MKKCPDCNSTKFDLRYKYAKRGDGVCGVCQGTGKDDLFKQFAAGLVEEEALCPACNDSKVCQTCDGEGVVEGEEEGEFYNDHKSNEEKNSVQDNIVKKKKRENSYTSSSYDDGSYDESKAPLHIGDIIRWIMLGCIIGFFVGCGIGCYKESLGGGRFFSHVPTAMFYCSVIAVLIIAYLKRNNRR